MIIYNCKQDMTHKKGVLNMTREEVIRKAWKIMLTWQEDFDFESYCTVFDMISDFNREHPEEEIFFCEDDGIYYLEYDWIQAM